MKTAALTKRLFIVLLLTGFAMISQGQIASFNNELQERLVAEGRDRVIENANRYLQIEPVTVTAKVSERSAGGPNDFYSEGDYWWPDPDNPDGPFIQRDGERFTGRFEHDRLVMRDFAEYTAALTSAWQDPNYIELFLRFDPEPTHPEVLRNHPVRHPVI